jgi:hypothetical protein
VVEKGVGIRNISDNTRLHFYDGREAGEQQFEILDVIVRRLLWVVSSESRFRDKGVGPQNPFRFFFHTAAESLACRPYTLDIGNSEVYMQRTKDVFCYAEELRLPRLLI